MADNIIRKDIVQIEFDTNLKELTKLNKEISALVKSFKGGIGDDEFDELKDNLNNSTKETKKLKDNLKDVANTSLTKINNGLKKMGSYLTNIAKRAVGAAYTGLKRIASISFRTLLVGLGAAAAATVKLANLASDLYETENKIDVSFGVKDSKGNVIDDTYSKQVKEWVKGSTASMGLAKQTALDMAALFGDMGTSMGLTAKEAANMSTSLVERAADIASFKNMDIDSVTTALNGVFTGETESLKRLGVVMTEQNLTQYAMSQGITKSIKDMTQAEKVQLRYKYVLDQTRNSMGDYKNTGGGFANQLRTMTENFKELGTVLGQLPMKKLASGMKVVNEALVDIQEILSDGFQEGDTDKILDIIEGLIDKGLAVVEEGLPVIVPKITSIIEKIIPKIVKILPKVAPVIITGIVRLIVSLVKAVKEYAPEILGAIKEIIADSIKIIYEEITGKKMSDDAFSGLKGGIEKIIPNIKSLIPVVTALIGVVKGIPMVVSILSFLGSFFGKKDDKDNPIVGVVKSINETFKELAKAKPTDILKGMGNLALIFGCFALITAAFTFVAPFIAKLGDAGSVLKVAAIMGVLGLVGFALAEAATLLSKIPIKSVLLGLANMGIALGAFAVAYMIMGAVSLIPFNHKAIVKLLGAITLMGLVGAALAGVAGLLGLIPVPVVLLGMANIGIALSIMTAGYLLLAAVALIPVNHNKVMKFLGMISLMGLVAVEIMACAAAIAVLSVVGLSGIGAMVGVIVGFGALVAALGALTSIKGFNELVESGGKAIVKMASIVGEVIGAIIGKVAEGVSNSLPKIGKNIADFGVALKPFFEAVNGSNTEGIGKFLESLGAFLILMAGEKVLSFFTGGINFSSLGTQLNTFATGAKGFFEKIADLPESSFTNATSLFECLAGIKSLPKDGGVVGWFTGEVNYENIAQGLGKLASEGVKKFFTMVSTFDKKTFDNTSQLFETLSGIKSLPKEGGFWQNLGDAITGKETKSALSVIATDLGSFGEKTKTFFESVNSLNLDKLNGLWKSLESAGKLTSTNLSAVIDESITALVNKISELPQKMGNAMKNNSKDLSDGMVKMWKDAVKASVSPVNKLLDGANHILKEFGSKKRVISWQPYAKGTDGHKGGNALVNDGRGAELVQMPNGSTFIPKGRNVFIPNAPKGMKVFSAEQTARLMGRNSPTFKYADGNVDIWSYIDDAGGLVKKITDSISYEGMSALASNMGKGMVTTFSGAMTTWVDKLFKEEGILKLGDYVASKGVAQWRSTVVRALKMEGQYSIANVMRTLFQMQTESGGNPRAINLWDDNAKKGTPSKGLMQVIDPTFNAYARKGFNKNIYDPLSNILASVRYAVSRYGSLGRAYRGVGYENGGLVTKTGVIAEKNKPEWVIPTASGKRGRALDLYRQAGQSLGLSNYSPEDDSGRGSAKAVEYNTYAPHFEVHISGTNDDRAMARKVKRWIAEAWDEMLNTYDGKNPQTQEI